MTFRSFDRSVEFAPKLPIDNLVLGRGLATGDKRFDQRSKLLDLRVQLSATDLKLADYREQLAGR